MFIKNLSPGQSFTADFTFGTVYTVDAITSDRGVTVMDYHIVSQYADEGVKPSYGRLVKASLTTITIAG